MLAATGLMPTTDEHIPAAVNAFGQDDLCHDTRTNRGILRHVLTGTAVLDRHRFDAGPLATMQRRLDSNDLPADDIIECFREHESLAEVLRTRTELAGIDAQIFNPSGIGVPPSV